MHDDTTTLEIERRFLVADEHVLDGDTEPAQIVQGYLRIDKAGELRVRLTRENAYLTLKSRMSGFTRAEWEIPVDPYDRAELMLLMCGDNVITKMRYPLVDEFEQFWVIDRFLDANEGLIIAEIELKSEGQPVHAPPWLGPEVTQDHRYSNQSLATRPYTGWK